jgi:hypothetical protein
MCGRVCQGLSSHHVIPRYMECSDDRDIAQVCRVCHTTADSRFDGMILPDLKWWMRECGLRGTSQRFKLQRFMLDPHSKSRGLNNWLDKNKSRATRIDWKEKYVRRTTIFYMRPIRDAILKQYVNYNIKTDDICFFNSYCKPYYGYIHKSKSLFFMIVERGTHVNVFYTSQNGNPYIYTTWRHRDQKR